MARRVGALIEGPGFVPYLSGRDNLRVLTALAGKAASPHTHTTSQVTGLDTALAAKADAATVSALTKVLVLGPSDSVPGGTAAGTAIIRRAS